MSEQRGGAASSADGGSLAENASDPPDDDEAERRVRAMAAEARSQGQPASAWFDRLYRAAAAGEAVVPWDTAHAQPLLAQWAASAQQVDGRRAVVVGAGLGRDIDLVTDLGYDVVAFDVSPAAVAGARQRHVDPQSGAHTRSAASFGVDYRVADLLDLPAAWVGAFDLVVESMTVQALPPSLRERATTAVASLVAPGGDLVVVAAASDATLTDEVLGPPWPLSQGQVEAFAAAPGMSTVSLQRLAAVAPGHTRWLATFRRERDADASPYPVPIALLAAVGREGQIGVDGRLPWHLPHDLAFFKATTTGHTMVMGRRTWDAIGRALPDRRTIVVTRQQDWRPAGRPQPGTPVRLASTPAEALVLAARLERMHRPDDPQVFVVGGGELYRQSIDSAQRLLVTHVDQSPRAEVYFPDIDPGVWREVSRESHDGFAFADYERREDPPAVHEP